MEKIIIDNTEYNTPEGFEAIGDDDVYMVDFDQIEVADEVDEDAKGIAFFNPRHLGQFKNNTETFLGQGFDKESMNELLDDITAKGLVYHLCGRWIKKNGKVKVQVNDGERRFRCIERMIAKDLKVYSSRDQSILPAKDVYARIPIKIKIMSEEESLMRACAVTNTAVRWGDAAYARLIKLLYQKGCTDDKICKLLSKGKQWVADTYLLNELDEMTFGYLLSNKINRSVALKLSRVPEVEQRQQWLIAAYEDALKNFGNNQVKAEEAVEKSEDKLELAKAELAEAKLKNETPEIIAELEENIDKLKKRTKKKKESRAASARPMAKSKNLGNTGDKDCLKPGKIKRQQKAIQELIENNDETYMPLVTLKIISGILSSILNGEEDILQILKRVS